LLKYVHSHHPTPSKLTFNYPLTPSPHAYAYERVDLPNGTYTFTQEEEWAASGEVNQIGVQQDLDQSPEEPKVVANIEEGKHRSAYNIFG
jgi:hypothetical protein